MKIITSASMTRLIIAVGTALLTTVVTAKAEIYDYSCKIDGKTHSLKVDDAKNVLEWEGKSYSLTDADCGRVGWHAEGNGTSFDFCTATKGYASVEQSGKVKAECDLKRR